MPKPRDTLESLVMTRSHSQLWLTYLQIRQGNRAIRNVRNHCEPEDLGVEGLRNQLLLREKTVAKD